MSFFSDLDRLVAKHRADFAATKDALRAVGWILRPLSKAGMWRSRRHTRRGTFRLYASSHSDLIRQATNEFGARSRRKKPEPRTEKAA